MQRPGQVRLALIGGAIAATLIGAAVVMAQTPTETPDASAAATATPDASAPATTAPDTSTNRTFKSNEDLTHEANESAD